MGLAINYMRSRGMYVRDLNGPDATKLNIDAALDEEDPIFCYWLGHGNSYTYTCQNQEVYMQTCNHNERLIGRNLLLLSCSCGIELGPDTASKGALAVHCWAVDFTWVAEGPPETDVYAQGFFEAVNEIAKAHAEGQLPNVAHERSLAIWNWWIDYWFASEDPNASLVVQHMIDDRDGMRLFGIGDSPSNPPVTEIGIPMWEIPLITGQGILLFTLIL
jgi:hypothetical protein